MKGTDMYIYIKGPGGDMKKIGNIFLADKFLELNKIFILIKTKTALPNRSRLTHIQISYGSKTTKKRAILTVTTENKTRTPSVRVDA